MMDMGRLSSLPRNVTNGRQHDADTRRDPLGPASKATPKQLVVLCHGLGADGYDLIDLGPAWAHACRTRCSRSVHAPIQHELRLRPAMVERRATARRQVMERGVRAAAAVLHGFIDAELARLGLPPDAYALMGFSQGAMTVAVHRPAPPRRRRAPSWRSPAR